MASNSLWSSSNKQIVCHKRCRAVHSAPAPRSLGGTKSRYRNVLLWMTWGALLPSSCWRLSRHLRSTSQVQKINALSTATEPAMKTGRAVDDRPNDVVACVRGLEV